MYLNNMKNESIAQNMCRFECKNAQDAYHLSQSKQAQIKLILGPRAK